MKPLRLLLLALPFPVLFLMLLELWVRFFVYEAAYRDGVCNKNFLPKTDHELRRLFHPGCLETVTTPDGRKITISTNEHGFRDRPAAEFKDGTLALLGDSHAEGFALNIEDSLSRRLEESGAFPKKILNIGYRATGALEQLRILAYARDHYKLEGVLWLLTENDILDDLYLRTRDPAYWATRLNIFFLKSSLALGRRWLTLEYLRVAMNGIALAHAAKTHAAEPMEKFFCETVLSARSLLGPDKPLTVLALPHGLPGGNLPYFGTQPDRASFWKAMDCVRGSGVRVLDLREPFAKQSAWLMSDRYHLGAEGTRLLAEEIASRFRAR
jgi:hypothetical protein